MSIERIKQEAAKADQIIMELAGRKGVNEQTTDGIEAEQSPVVDQQVDQGVAQTVATEDEPAVPAADDGLARIREDAAKWEQRYRSLDGMIQARDRQIDQLHQLLAGMQANPATRQDTEQPQAKHLVKKEDEEAFGADLIDLARRISKEESGAYIEALEGKLAALEERLSGVAQTTAVSVHERFETRLTEAAPSWKKHDDNPAFIEWLQASPTRHKLFAEAVRAQEVGDVAYFFNEFDKQQAPAPTAIDPRLERQIAPGKSKSVATQAKNPADKKQWTRTEIADFFSNGKKRYSAEDFARMERDAFAAQKEGRVDFSR